MKKQDMKQLHAKTKEELMVTLRQLKKDLEKNNIEFVMNKLKNTNFTKAIKKDIARVLTILKEKEDEYNEK